MAMFRYFSDGEEVSEAEFLARRDRKRQRIGCKPGEGLPPLVMPDRADYRGERDRRTGMDGRYYPQLARFPGDKRAVFPTKRSALENAYRRGFVEDKNDDSSTEEHR